MSKMDKYTPFQSIGWILMILGLVFITLPYISRIIPDIEKIPWWILWVYKRDGFYFATSPLLIILSIVSILWSFLR